MQMHSSLEMKSSSVAFYFCSGVGFYCCRTTMLCVKHYFSLVRDENLRVIYYIVFIFIMRWTKTLDSVIEPSLLTTSNEGWSVALMCFIFVFEAVILRAQKCDHVWFEGSI